ncbi:tissue inhibitor of metalloproteinase-like [Lytechinus variegatus]|uniref:tissue inhibitor of metalloproteinase-like n=1 Tax=Lytechinus variegatus TaxID=7654 RepID=UPI001BB16A96|nr:tissue inhibitor of metalloproteinase-like [Lytechinus variegatus]
MEFRQFILRCGVVLSCFLQFLPWSEACNCLVNHPQTKYCFSDFVIQARVLERKRIEHPDKSRPINYRFLIGYRVRILGIFKGGDYLGDVEEEWIHSPDAGGLCGVTGLVRNGEYLLSGRYTRDIFYMTYCDMWSEWDKLTEEQLYGMTSIYNDNCKCRIRGVIGIINIDTHSKDSYTASYVDKSPLWDDGSCRYNPVASLFYKSHDCETMYSHCIWANDTCLWEPSRDYNLCYQAREAMWRHRHTNKYLPANVPKRRLRCKNTSKRFVRRCANAYERRMQKRRLAQGKRPPVKYIELLLNGYTTNSTITTSTALMG